MNHKQLAKQYGYSPYRVKKYIDKVYPSLKGRLYTYDQWNNVWVHLIEKDLKSHIRKVERKSK